MGINKKDFNKFTRGMWSRLKKGEEKYGEQYKTGDLTEALLEEALDLSNYAFMMFLKAKEFSKKVNKLTKGL